VDVIVPFAGAPEALASVAARLSALNLRPGDSATVVDNRPAGAPPVTAPAPVRIVPAPERQSSYFARNRGAAFATGDWLVFLDGDVRCDPDLLDRFFDPEPAPADGVLAGAIVDEIVEDGVIARWLAARGAMSQENTLEHARPYAQTACCAVRRSAFDAVGGFDETIRSGGDADLCFRLADAGWAVASRPGAVARHEARARLVRLLGQIARHGSGAAWLERRHPGTFPRTRRWPGLVSWALRAPFQAAAALARRDRDRAAHAVLLPLIAWAFELGRLVDNAAPQVSGRRWRLRDRLLR
jgi:GT2 family glycosyltransferase